MRVMTRRSGFALSLACAALLALSAAPAAQATRALLTQKAVDPEEAPSGQIEGACGVAVAANSDLFVSDYYHAAVATFGSSGGGLPYEFKSQIASVGSPPEGPCGLAFDTNGALYANVWHQRVVRLKPTVQVFDTADATGVSVDPATDLVYVDNRTYVSVYEPSGAPVLDGGEPLRIGLGTLGDGFGVAAFAGRVFVPDASNDTVKVYEPTTDTVNPIATITGSAVPLKGFVSLVDAAVAIDPTNSHLLVVDNLKPGYVSPEAAIYEFDFSGAYLGRLPGAPVHGGPSGIAVDPARERLFVTSGNTELANVFAYGAFGTSSGFSAGPPGSEGSSAGASTFSAVAAGPPAPAGSTAVGEGSSPRSWRHQRRGKKRDRARGRVGVGRASVARASDRSRG